MEDNTPLEMGNWILYRDTGRLLHKPCGAFHVSPSRDHWCYSMEIISFFIVTTVNICRKALQEQQQRIGVVTVSNLINEDSYEQRIKRMGFTPLRNRNNGKQFTP